MPGRLAELSQVSARLRAGVTKEAGVAKAIGKWAVKNPLKAVGAAGGSYMAGSAGLGQARATRASFQPAVRDYNTGL